MAALATNVVDMIPEIFPDLRCPSCGVTTEAKCSCGQGYEVVKPRDAVDKYDKVNPGQPIKKVTEAVRVGHATVSRARAARRATEPNVQNGPLRNSKVQTSDGRMFPITKKYTAQPKQKEYVACEPVFTKDPSVNEALTAVYDHIIAKGWSDYQLELFIGGVRKLHDRAKEYGIEWHEAVESRKQEKRNQKNPWR